MYAGAAEPIRQVQHSPDQPARVVSSSSFYKVEKALTRLAARRLESLMVWFERKLRIWACAVQYRVLGNDVMSMNIIKDANFRGALCTSLSLAYSIANCFRRPWYGLPKKWPPVECTNIWPA